MTTTLHNNFCRALKKLYPKEKLENVIKSINYTGETTGTSSCICGHKIHIINQCTVGPDNVEIEVGTDCVYDCYETDPVKFENLEKILFNQCRSCENYNIKKKKYKTQHKNYYCQDCSYKTMVKYECGHYDEFDVVNYKECSDCKSKREEKEKENLWVTRLKRYIRKGLYKRCIECRKLKEENKGKYCDGCYTIIKNKEWVHEVKGYELTGIYKKCIECRQKKGNDKWTKCYKCNTKDKDKCKCGKLKDIKYNSCWTCKDKDEDKDDDKEEKNRIVDDKGNIDILTWCNSNHVKISKNPKCKICLDMDVINLNSSSGATLCPNFINGKHKD